MANNNNSLEMAIQAYLDNRVKEDSLFAETYKKENKSIKECCDYVMQQARKMANKQNTQGVAIDDATVYGWAVHYYDEDDIKVSSIKERVKVSSSVTEGGISPASPEAPLPTSVKKGKNKKEAKKDPWEERQLSFNFD